MPDNDEKLPGFKKFAEFAGLLKEFGDCCYVDYRTAALRRDKDNGLGDAEKIGELYGLVRGGSPDMISPYGISFTILCDNDGNWLAFPNLPDRHPFKVTERLFVGINHDWQEKLIDVVVKMCGLEPSDGIRQHLKMM